MSSLMLMINNKAYTKGTIKLIRYAFIQVVDNIPNSIFSMVIFANAKMPAEGYEATLNHVDRYSYDESK